MAREHEKKHEKEEHKRARGGSTPREHNDGFRKDEDREDEDRDEDENEKAEKKHEDRKEETPKRKRGGKVHGKKVESRPDRRARGGATSDPTTEAGKMSRPPFERHDQAGPDKGESADRG